MLIAFIVEVITNLIITIKIKPQFSDRRIVVTISNAVEIREAFGLPQSPHRRVVVSTEYRSN